MADQLSPTDVVPAFRSDLKLADPVQGAGEKLVTVADPVSGKSMAFRGFELSIARMLNGQRTAAEVIDAAGAIGLPISIEGLSGFVKKLRSLNFLVHPLDGPVQQPTTWGERREWSDEIRRRYQSALKEARSNELLSAKEHLTALLADAPDNDDVRGLLQWVDERLKAPAAGKKLPPFTDVFSVVERTWFEEGERQSQENQRLASLSDVPAVTDPSMEHQAPAPAVAASAAAAADDDDEPPKKKGGAGKVVLVLLLLLIAGGGAAAALVPLPHVVTGAYELQPKSSLNVEVAREGVVGEVSVKDGDWVEAGAQVFTYDTEAAKKKLAEAEEKVAELQKKAEKSGGKKAADARKKLDKAKKALDDARAELEKAKAKGKKAAIAKQEKKVKKAEAAAAKAQKALDAATGAASGDAKADLDKAVAERDALKGQTEAAPFNAPVAGFVKDLKVKPGDEVKLGTPVAVLVDTKALTVKLQAPSEAALQEGQTVTLDVGGKSVELKVEKIVNGEPRGVLENPKGELKAGDKGSVKIDTGGKTLLSRYL